MSERNAKLLRRYIRFFDIPEVIEPSELSSVRTPRPNPVISDFKHVFRHGTSRQKETLASYMRTHMATVEARRAAE